MKMDSAKLFLITFSALISIIGIIVYNLDFSKWEKHSHEQ